MKKIAATFGALAAIVLIGAAPEPAEMPPVDRGIMQMQVILDHLGFGPGVIDGRRGQSLEAALKGFQETRNLKVTGKVDAQTLAQLRRYSAMQPTRTVLLSREVLSGPFVNPLPKDPAIQAKLASLAYSSPMEAIAERYHTTREVLISLNSPETPLRPGQAVVVPNASPFSRDYAADIDPEWRATLLSLNVDARQPVADHIVVDKSDAVLRVLDSNDRLVAQFSATMGSSHDPLPIGTWKVQGTDTNPKFHYNPSLFWDASSKASDALLPPGPNGPVGVVWMDLSKPHYGIHGTPAPETIGRAESHGCIRLTNWDAARLALMVKPGTTAIFKD